MAHDRFVWFEKGKAPKKQEIKTLLEDYFRDLAVSMVWQQGRFFIVLPGQPSWALARMPGVSENTRQARLEDKWEDNGDPRERYIEVFLGVDNIDIITRFMDDVTHAMADGLAQVCARFWRGKLDDH